MENKTTEAPGGKKRGRFNFIDFILIAVALVALGVLVYIVVGPKASKTAQPATFSVQYTVEIKHLREDWRDLIGIGDVVTDADSLTTIGTVTDISYQNELCSSYDSRTGEVIYVEHPDEGNDRDRFGNKDRERLSCRQKGILHRHLCGVASA